MKHAGIVIAVIALVISAGTAVAGVYVDLIPQTEKWYVSEVTEKLLTQRMHTVVEGRLDGMAVIRRDIWQNGAIIQTDRLLMSGTVDGDIYNHGTLEAGAWSEPVLWVDVPLAVGKTWTASRAALDGVTTPDNRIHYVFAVLEEQTVTCPAGLFPAQRVFVAAVYPDGHTETCNYWYSETCGMVMMCLENARVFVLNKAVAGDENLRRDPVYDVIELQDVTAFPNPSNPLTSIFFDLGRAGPVDVAVYDVAGRLVRRLASGLSLGPGPQSLTWDGRNQAGEPAAAGVYLYQVRAGAAVQNGRLTLVR